MDVRYLKDVIIQTDQERLIILMRQLGMKQYEFARELGYSPEYLESVINGRKQFTESLTRRINAYLLKRMQENLIYEEEMSNLFHR